MSRFEDAVRHDLAAAPLPPPVERLRRRAQLRRLRMWVTGIAAVVAVGAGTVPVVRSVQRKPTINVSPAVNGTTAASTIAPTTTSTRPTGVTFPISTPATVNPAAPEPSHFLASIGAGGERTALVDVATGSHGPFLTPPSQLLVRFSRDLTTIYDPVASMGCGYAWSAIRVADGSSKPAYRDLNYPIDVAESPDGKKIAYLRPQNGTSCVPVLVVRDAQSGRERHWSEPTDPSLRGETITQLQWSPDSSHVSYEFHAVKVSGNPKPISRPTQRPTPFTRIDTAWVLDINRGTTITDGIPLRNPDAQCLLWVPRFQPGTNLIVAAENCIGRSVQLVSYNITTGAIEKTATVATGPVFGIIDLAIDASGQHLLYILSYEANQPSEVYTLRSGTPVRLLNDAYQVAW
jgi:hypothetical protein